MNIMARMSSFAFKLLLFISFFTTFLILPLITSAKPQRVVTKLIHHNSIFSPFYSPNDTVVDRAKHVLRNSNSRLACVQKKAKRTAIVSNTDAQANLRPDGGGFLVSFDIGEPPIPQLAVMDSGSSLTWVRCTHCENCDGQFQVFDPMKSSTYRASKCQDISCSKLHLQNLCRTPSDPCLYRIRYEDYTTSMGCIASEQLRFETSDEDKVVVQDVILGCDQRRTRKDSLWNGVFALGNSPISVVHKLGSRFSYCIGNVNDPAYRFNRLTLGDGVMVEGYSTPFQEEGGFYYVTLEGISLGPDRLDIDPQAFMRTSRGGGVILDCGAELTYLPENVYNTIAAEVSILLDRFLKRLVDKDSPWRLCYYGAVDRDLEGFPVMTFHLAKGADLVSDVGSLFHPISPKAFCISIQPIISNDERYVESSLIGVMAQQNYNVAFELVEREIYFQRIDCELLED